MAWKYSIDIRGLNFPDGVLIPVVDTLQSKHSLDQEECPEFPYQNQMSVGRVSLYIYIPGSKLTYSAKSNKKWVFEHWQKFNIQPNIWTEIDYTIKFKVVN